MHFAPCNNLGNLFVFQKAAIYLFHNVVIISVSFCTECFHIFTYEQGIFQRAKKSDKAEVSIKQEILE